MSNANGEYLEALSRLKAAPSDRIGSAGVMITSGLAGSLGWAAAPSIASWFGASTIFGSQFLAQILGGVFVATTPVGWLACVSLSSALAAYGVTKLIRSGERSDVIRSDLEAQINEKIVSGGDPIVKESSRVKFNEIISTLQGLVASGRISPEKSTALIKAVHEGALNVESALETVLNFERGNIYVPKNVELMDNAHATPFDVSFDLVHYGCMSKKIISEIISNDDERIEKFGIIMQNEYALETGDAVKMFHALPMTDGLREMLKSTSVEASNDYILSSNKRAAHASNALRVGTNVSKNKYIKLEPVDPEAIGVKVFKENWWDFCR